MCLCQSLAEVCFFKGSSYPLSLDCSVLDLRGGTTCNFPSSLCWPPRMKPYRIISTLRRLLPQHRQLACHNTLTQSQRGGKGGGGSQLDLSKPHFGSAAGGWMLYLPSAASWATRTKPYIHCTLLPTSFRPVWAHVTSTPFVYLLVSVSPFSPHPLPLRACCSVSKQSGRQSKILITKITALPLCFIFMLTR